MIARRTLVSVAATGVVVTIAGVGVADAASNGSTHAKRAAGARAGGLLGRVEHGSVVVEGAKGQAIDATLAGGTVTSVSATSLTITSVDGTATTFAISATTRVRQLGSGLTTAAAIHTGAKADVVGVAGTARRVILARS